MYGQKLKEYEHASHQLNQKEYAFITFKASAGLINNFNYRYLHLNVEWLQKLMMKYLMDVTMQSVKSNVYKAHNFITKIFFSERNVYKALRNLVAKAASEFNTKMKWCQLGVDCMKALEREKEALVTNVFTPAASQIRKSLEK